MSGSSKNLALVFSKIPSDFPVPGEHLTIESVDQVSFDSLPGNHLAVEGLYASLDPYIRGLLRPKEVKSYFPALDIGQVVPSASLGKVLKSTSSEYQEGDIISGLFPIQQYYVIDASSSKPTKVDTDNGSKDIRHQLSALGMPGLTAYASLYEIGKPKKGETIFISSAAGPVGQLVGQLSKHEGMKVFGSVGSDEKAKYLVEELGFDGAFNYRKEKASDALPRLAPGGIDIYYENVGGEQLEAAINNMNLHGRIVACGMISQYNLPQGQAYGVKNLMSIVGKRLTMRGFIVGDEEMGPAYAKEHQEKVWALLQDGKFVDKFHEWTGIEKGSEAFTGMLKGENFGKAILKIQT